MNAKMKTIGVVSAVAVAAAIAGAWYLHARESDPEYLYSRGRYEEFLRYAPRTSEFEQKRLRAIFLVEKARCQTEVPQIRRTLTSLEASAQYSKMLSVEHVSSCARFDDEIAVALKRATVEAKRQADEAKIAANQAKVAAMYAERGGKEGFLRKMQQLARSNPAEAAEQLHPFYGLGDSQADAVFNAAWDADQKILDRKNAREERERHASEMAERKREGVRLGMTKERVVQSSWGRPERINRTIVANGEHEQWVYGTGNYLYFDNGILTAIQNGQ